MASPPLVLPGALFVGEDDRARILAHTGPAAGWHVPKGILGWSHEVSVVAREALTEDIRKATKIVMPEEQIPPARMPLTAQAAQKSPLVAVSSKIVSKLVELGVRVHTVGVDRVTSSFYYLAEGGGEEQIRIEGDLVQAVGAMLGERADNAAIERVLDGLPDRLLRALSKDRVSELTIELAAALPRAAADGSGTQEVDLDAFEKELGTLIGESEKLSGPAREIAAKLADTNERKLDVPLYGDARKVSQGPFDLTVGDRRVSLPTYERWVMGSDAAPTSARTQASRSPATADANDAMLAGLEAKPSAEELARKAEAEAAAKRKAEEEAAAAKKRAEEEAAAKKRAEEEAAKKRAEAEAAAKKRAEEEAAAAAAKKKAEEEAAAAAAKKKAEEEAAAAAAKKKAEEEAAAAKKKAEEEAAAAAKKAEEAAAAAKAEEEAAAKKKDESKKKDEDGEKAAAKSDDKKAAKTATAEKGQSRIDTVKVKRAEPEKKSSGGMMWMLVLLVVVSAAAYWRFFMHK